MHTVSRHAGQSRVGVMVTRRSVGVAVERLYGEATEGSNDVWHGSARVVVKTVDPHSNPGLAANEFIAARLAMALGVPVPMGDAADWEGRRAFVSAQVDIEGQVPPPADVSSVVAEMSAEAAMIFIFDVLVLNDDRHEENLLYHPKVGLWAIDHEQALGGEAVMDPVALARLTSSPISIPCDAFLDLDPTDLLGPAWRVKSLQVAAIEAATKEAQVRRLLTGAQAQAVTKFLKYRRDHIDSLTHRSLAAKGGTFGWPKKPESTGAPLPGT